MESEDTLAISFSEEATKGLLPYMEITRTGTVSEFIRAAINYCLAQQDREPLTPALCTARDIYPEVDKRKKEFKATLELHGNAGDIIQTIRDPIGDEWIANSLRSYATALDPLLSPPERVQTFSYVNTVPTGPYTH